MVPNNSHVLMNYKMVKEIRDAAHKKHFLIKDTSQIADMMDFHTRSWNSPQEGYIQCGDILKETWDWIIYIWHYILVLIIHDHLSITGQIWGTVLFWVDFF